MAGRRGRATSPPPSATSSAPRPPARRRCSSRPSPRSLWANSPWSDSYESVWTTELSIQLGELGRLARPARVDQRGPDDVLLPRRRARGQARARPGPAARAAADLALRWPPRWAACRCRSRSSSRSTRAATARTAGARRCRPTPRSRSACSRSSPRAATRLRVRLLTLAVIDDFVALIVIATAYTEHINVVPLAVAAGLFADAVRAALRAARVARCGSPRSSASRCGSRC